MSWTERIRRLWRVDMQIALVQALLFAPLIAIVLSCLYTYAAGELLELVQVELDERLGQIEAVLREQEPALRSTKLGLLGEQLARDDGGFRISSEDGPVLSSSGRPITTGADLHEPRWLASIRIGAGEILYGERRLTSGEHLEVGISSREFVRERDEVQRGFWLSLGAGIVLAFLGVVPATRHALAPLRRATAATRRIDPERLDVRLPVRGIPDEVDEHARVVNQLLDRLESGFARTRQFSQDVAHELRTPVNRILNVAEIGLMAPEPTERSRGELEVIRNEAGNLARTIDGLLLLARSESGQETIAMTRLDVGELCHALAEMYEPVCEELGLDFSADVDVVGRVFGEPALLLRVLSNLVDNAIAHSPPGGAIRLTAASSPSSGSDWLEIKVEDDGPGVEAGDRERVFDRFVRVEFDHPSERGRDASAHFKGSGLGLAIARALVAAHGGELKLRGGEGASIGACFVVLLPCDHVV